MDRASYDARIARDGAAIVAACRAAPGAPVPSCPDWTTDDLLDHIAKVHDGWAATIGTPFRRVDELVAHVAARASPPDPDVARQALLDVLAAAPDERECWTWVPSERRVGLVRRVQATEALVHRVDAEQAAGIDVHVDSVEAVDSIETFLRYTLDVEVPSGTVDARLAVPDDAGTVRVECDDVAGASWIVAADGGVTRPAPGDAAADVVVSGAAADVVLALWRRVPLDTCAVRGTPQAVAAFAERCVVRQ